MKSHLPSLNHHVCKLGLHREEHRFQYHDEAPIYRHEVPLAEPQPLCVIAGTPFESQRGRTLHVEPYSRRMFSPHAPSPRTMAFPSSPVPTHYAKPVSPLPAARVNIDAMEKHANYSVIGLDKNRD